MLALAAGRRSHSRTAKESSTSTAIAAGMCDWAFMDAKTQKQGIFTAGQQLTRNEPDTLHTRSITRSALLLPLKVSHRQARVWHEYRSTACSSIGAVARQGRSPQRARAVAG